MGVSFRRFPTRWWASFWFSSKPPKKREGGYPDSPKKQTGPKRGSCPALAVLPHLQGCRLVGVGGVLLQGLAKGLFYARRRGRMCGKTSENHWLNTPLAEPGVNLKGDPYQKQNLLARFKNSACFRVREIKIGLNKYHGHGTGLVFPSLAEFLTIECWQF